MSVLVGVVFTVMSDCILSCAALFFNTTALTASTVSLVLWNEEFVSATCHSQPITALLMYCRLNMALVPVHGAGPWCGSMVGVNVGGVRFGVGVWV